MAVVVDAVAPEGDGVFIVSFSVTTSTGQTFTGNATVDVRSGEVVVEGDGGGCAVAGPGTTKASLAGLLLYTLLPIAIVARRRFRRK